MSSQGEQQVAVGTVDEWAFDAASGDLPRTADVVIIGGGIVGCATAYFLARRGIAVVLCEKGRIAGEQSGRNWGWVRQQGRSPLELPLMMESLRIWRGLQQELGQEIGEDLGFAQGGCLYLARDRAELERHGEWLAVARAFGLDTRLLSAHELGAILHGAGNRWAGALYTASDGRAEPNRATAAIARGAGHAGARIVSGCAVRGIERQAGRVRAVITEHGVVAAPLIVCAAGAWTSMFCRSLGIDVPQLRVMGTVARTAPAMQILDGTAWSPEVAIRRRADGGYTVAHGAALEHALVPASLRFAGKFLPALRQESGAIRLRLGREFLTELVTPTRWDPAGASPFERGRVLAPPPSQRILGEVRAALGRWFPEIAAAPLVETWAGIIETSPDVLPVISPVPGLAGFHVATGFSGHGFGIGPGAGALIARMVTGEAGTKELAPFRLSRFYDGSPIRPGPTI